MRAHLACITSTIFHLLARIGPFKFKHFSAQFEGSPECCSVIRDGSLPAYSSQINQCAFHKNSFNFPTACKAPHLFLYVAGSLRKGSLATNVKPYFSPSQLPVCHRCFPAPLRSDCSSLANLHCITALDLARLFSALCESFQHFLPKYLPVTDPACSRPAYEA